MADLIQIQDESLRRVTDLLGLRGTLPHEYINLVVPVVVVGDARQKHIIQRQQPPGAGPNLFYPFGPVPAGKTWKPVTCSVTVTQSGGASGLVTSWIVSQTGDITAGTYVPFYQAVSNANDATPAVIRRSAAVNLTTTHLLVFPPDMLIPAGGLIICNIISGDGAINFAGFLEAIEIGEVLVALQ